MSWHDPNSPWSRAMRRRLLKAYLPLIVATASSALIVGFFAWVLLRTSLQSLSMLAYATPAIIIGLALVNALPGIIREHRVGRRVPESDGLLCPKCRIRMQIADGSAVLCPKCHGWYTNAAELQRYWEQYALEPQWAGEWLLQRHIAGRGASASASRFSLAQRVLRSNPYMRVAWCVAIFTCMGLLLGTLRSGSVVRSAFQFFPIMVLMAGLTLYAHGRRRRIGDSRHCAQCGYEQGPALASASRCPECGFAWIGHGGTVHGQLVHRPGLRLTGAAIMLLGGVLVVSPFFARGWTMRLLPTSALIAEVTSDGFNMNEWAALRGRTLTEDQRLALAVGLLEKQLRTNHLWRDDETWLVAQVQFGALPPEIADRYYRQMLESWIIAPELAQAGEPITVAIGSRYRSGFMPASCPLVYFGGFEVDGQGVPRARQERPVSAQSFGRERHHGRMPVETRGGTSPETVVVPERAGRLQIRAKLWIAMLPFSASTLPIAWNDDGTPQIPSAATRVTYVELEHAVDVE